MRWFSSEQDRGELMHSVRADFPVNWERCNVYCLSDLHIGDEHSATDIIAQRIEQAANDPYGVVVLNGDIMNTATKASPSDLYSEQLSPMQQINAAVTALKPVKEKVIAACCGNHEARIYRTDGIDTMRLVCRELGVEDKYHPDGVLVFLRFGTRTSGHYHRDKNPKQWYSLYVTHGSGGGRKEGGKANRLADLNGIVDADIYIHGHTHLPMVFKESYYRTDASNCCAKMVEKLFVNTAAALNYGGYGQAQAYKPASVSNPVIHLESAKKHATATI